MKFEVSISPEMLAAITSEAKAQRVTASHVVREIIGATYGLESSVPRHFQASSNKSGRPH